MIEGERTPYAFSGFFSPYRYVYYQLTKKQCMGFIPCGVTGVVSLRGKIILARRSKQVIGNAGLFEFAPSGTLEKGLEGEEKAAVDCEGILLKELKEELGVPQDAVVSSRPLCLALDLADNVLDVIYWVVLKDSVELRIGSEHTECLMISLKELGKLIVQRPNQFTSQVKFIVRRNVWSVQ
ncbi:MAG: NUDIX hydrolase [Candidatus Spechtbacteria bacterium]|nr:NUDIX hydrolase [Candidatus Spechtbacteria bacterium]